MRVNICGTSIAAVYVQCAGPRWALGCPRLLVLRRIVGRTNTEHRTGAHRRMPPAAPDGRAVDLVQIWQVAAHGVVVVRAVCPCLRPCPIAPRMRPQPSNGTHQANHMCHAQQHPACSALSGSACLVQSRAPCRSALALCGVTQRSQRRRDPRPPTVRPVSSSRATPCSSGARRRRRRLAHFSRSTAHAGARAGVYIHACWDPQGVGERLPAGRETGIASCEDGHRLLTDGTQASTL
jgi:hypothetical protein